MLLLDSLFLIILMLLPLGLVVVFITYNKKRLHNLRKNPINSDLLRSPGESLWEKIEELKLDIDSYLTILPVAPLLLYITYLKSSQSTLVSSLLLLLGILITGIATYKLSNLVNTKHKLALGYDAELSVGQELNTLMREGYYVYHDFPFDNFNIDHIVVGETGIFAVETKGRSKPILSKGKAEYKLKYDGKQLIFPNWTETKPLEQTTRQAITLQKWLSSAIGETIQVTPVLAIPGWYIERTYSQGILVINGKNPLNVIGKNTSNVLNKKIIAQIIHQLEQRCRTVKPQAK